MGHGRADRGRVASSSTQTRGGLEMTRRQSAMARRLCAVVGILALVLFTGAQPASANTSSVKNYGGLTKAQHADLMNIARDSWKFFAADIDPATHLPMDNV